ncbi:1,2-phenylacetyl-CoA epoxidase subunit PaaC [Granulosicoccus antarcticus]|uniref:1,2-phenylacetyl-CoA epoxidase, subunit C n=1 Tax=Granulosicoccus antarcticus IMCC3135 TaxID=1192854 RepID=A0A2Z2P2H8_9GAMM|nr:1,2-phenylacetyl-CoA epoxidase subunit PaaC [Granulosicoccus antarcticus]ASJ76831.1 1,2-phenylacetyl-CoA epoxidase, subunit C [Granulosicoccus antarcticus IMCC3135]
MAYKGKADNGLFEFLLQMGDNCLILGHRNSEWCGHAPALEEDIAVANVSLDLIGQTQMWLELAGEVEGAGRSADDLAYLRDAFDFRNLLLLERPNTDFGLTLVRQFLFDAWHLPMLRGLMNSTDKRIADIAEKSVKEVAYHLERSTDLIIRLGDGSAESHRRMQDSLNELWSYTGEMFEFDDLNPSLVAEGLVPAAAEVADAWKQHVTAALKAATLSLPETGFIRRGGKDGIHSEHLGFLLAEMQFLQRAYPGASW